MPMTVPYLITAVDPSLLEGCHVPSSDPIRLLSRPLRAGYDFVSHIGIL